jgi:hypothetical protein
MGMSVMGHSIRGTSHSRDASRTHVRGRIGRGHIVISSCRSMQDNANHRRTVQKRKKNWQKRQISFFEGPRKAASDRCIYPLIKRLCATQRIPAKIDSALSYIFMYKWQAKIPLVIVHTYKICLKYALCNKNKRCLVQYLCGLHRYSALHCTVQPRSQFLHSCICEQ